MLYEDGQEIRRGDRVTFLFRRGFDTFRGRGWVVAQKVAYTVWVIPDGEKKAIQVSRVGLELIRRKAVKSKPGTKPQNRDV